MVKNIYEPSYSDNKSNVFVKSISGAIVIHCGTNDLNRQEQPEEFAFERANLASYIKSKKNEVVV